jgi:peptide/nickel transport system substrate-binding protein
MFYSRLSTLLLGLTLTVCFGTALAQPKVLPDYSGLGLEPGQQGGTLTLSIADAPQTFFYYGVIDPNHQTINLQMFDPLVEYNLETYEIEPALATSWEVSEDGRIWAFQLREGVTWHDGEPFTAEDVVFTYEQIVMNEETRAGDVGEFVFDGERAEWEALDDHTVQVTMPVTSAVFLETLRKPIMPRHKLLPFSIEGGAAPADINNAWGTDTDPSEIVGTGPFRLMGYTPGQLVTLERNPNYWKQDAAGNTLPYVETLRYLIVRGAEQQAAQFLAGNIDQVNISGAQFPDLKQRELEGADFRVEQSEALFGSPPHLAFNFDAADPQLAEVFANDAFRQAMEQAVDRVRVIEDVYNGLAQIPGTPTAPIAPFYEDTTDIMRDFDLQAAGAALDELGLADTNGDGVRNITPDRELEFTLTYNADSQVFTDIATILENDFEQIGVRANLQGIQGSALVSTALAGDFEAIIVAFGNLPDPELRRPIWQPGGSLYYWHRALQAGEGQTQPNFEAMKDWEQRLWEIFDEGARITDQERRQELYAEHQRINAEFVPVIMIAKPANIAAVRDRVQNFVYNLGVIPGYNPVPLYFIEQ